MNKILITGGTGFIGQSMMDADTAWIPPHSIRAIDRVEYDSREWMKERWDYIIHLAPVTVDDVAFCAQMCRASVLLASSGGVYDREPSDYFRMKQEDERKLLASGLDVKIARIFTTCGAHMQWDRYAIGNFIQQAEAGKIEVQSYGAVVRSYMYGSDLAEWLWTILLKGEPGGIYNVGSDVPHTTLELAFEIASHFDPVPVVHRIPKMQHEPRPFYLPDISKAREELGLEIKVPFEEAVRRTVEDYRNENGNHLQNNA